MPYTPAGDIETLQSNFNQQNVKITLAKDGLWLQYVGLSNSLCTRAFRAITNYMPIGKYRLRFFLSEEFKCSCSQYPIETRCYILYDCRRFNEYWNSRRDFIAYFVMFLECNSNIFVFSNDIT